MSRRMMQKDAQLTALEAQATEKPLQEMGARRQAAEAGYRELMAEKDVLHEEIKSRVIIQLLPSR